MYITCVSKDFFEFVLYIYYHMCLWCGVIGYLNFKKSLTLINWVRNLFFFFFLELNYPWLFFTGMAFVRSSLFKYKNKKKSIACTKSLKRKLIKYSKNGSQLNFPSLPVTCFAVEFVTARWMNFIVYTFINKRTSTE